MAFSQSQINGSPNLDFSSLKCKERDSTINILLSYFQNSTKIKKNITCIQIYGDDSFCGIVTKPGQWAQSQKLQLSFIES